MRRFVDDDNAGWRRELATLDPLLARLPASPNAARTLHAHGRLEAAIEAYYTVFRLDANNSATPRELSAALASSGRREEARQVLSEACRLDARRLGVAAGARTEVAAYLLARELGGETPARAPAAYVRAVFDDAAAEFDHRLIGRLGYCAPQLLATAVRRRTGGRAADLRVLDAGCGTGLAAALLRPLARELDGVDLSPRMINKARARRLYDRLSVSEVEATLMAAEPYDLVFAADMFPYIGDLATVLTACRGSVGPWRVDWLHGRSGNERRLLVGRVGAVSPFACVPAASSCQRPLRRSGSG